MINYNNDIVTYTQKIVKINETAWEINFQRSSSSDGIAHFR